MKIIILVAFLTLLVFPMYLFQADAQLPGSMSTKLHENVVVFDTKQGKIVIELFPDEAPKHVENFLDLVSTGFYDRTIFHRIIPGFMIQGGDPTTKPAAGNPWEWGKGGPGYSIDGEFNQLMHNRGMVSMARSASPDSAGSQFFIVHEHSHFLDGEYTVFGRLLTQESYDTLDALASLPTTTVGPPGQVTSGVNDIPMDYGSAELVSAYILTRSDIADKLTLGMPDRMTDLPKITPRDTTYTNTEFGFSFNVPGVFLVSEPERIDDKTPVVTLVGERQGKYSPTVYVQVLEPTADTFQEMLQQRLEQLQPSVDAGKMQILSADYVTINEMNGFAIAVKTEHVTNSGPEVITFKQFLFPTDKNVYALVFSDASSNFDEALTDFDVVLSSFSVKGVGLELVAEPLVISEIIEDTSSNDGGGCLIATAAFGSEMAPQVQFLRELRDNTVLQTQSGTSFMTGFNQFYYSFSPAVADLERENPAFKETVKLTLTPLLTSLTLLNYIDIDTESEMLGYGIGIIMLNIGMYFVAPAILVKSVKRFLTKQK